MEVLLGALLTLTIIIANNLILKDRIKKMGPTKIRYTQSHVQMLLSPLRDYFPLGQDDEEPAKTQSKSYVEKSYVKVVISENNAYWIKDNALYTAEVIEGFVDKESSRRVDTMGMNKVELEKTMAIVEKLREGLDEDSGAGK